MSRFHWWTVLIICGLVVSGFADSTAAIHCRQKSQPPPAGNMKRARQASTSASVPRLFKELGVTSATNTSINMGNADKANPARIKALLAQGVDVNATGPVGCTPLMVAVMSDNHKIAKLLLDHGANVNARNSGVGETAIEQATETSDIAMMKLLLAHRANVNIQDRAGMTALMYARSAEKVKLLLDRHANLNIRDHAGKTAITYARSMHSNTVAGQQENARIIRLLEQAGAKE